ncbi:Elongation factor Ts, mitochondrial [Ceratobasidium sp. 423]|nr:Elongation factor Ts, mitochondrial [Ceratobasidium sp. 423]
MLYLSRNAFRSAIGSATFHTSRSCNAELKASIKLIAEIRKITDNQTSFAKAKEALLATNNDLDIALQWLEKDNIASGAKRAAKVASRIANDGLVGIFVLADGGSQAGASNRVAPVRAAMVEVNCETDFVARNEIFSKLVADIAHTTAYLAEAPSESQALSKPGLISPFPIDVLADAPLVRAPSDSSPPEPTNTISSAIQDATSKLGEKISLRRACSFVGPALPPSSNIGLRVGTYLHLSGNQSQTGKIGALVALALKSNNLSKFVQTGDNDTRALARALARQVVGLGAGRVGDVGSTETGDASSTALYEQPFMMQPGGGTDKSVRAALNSWAQEKGLASGGPVNEGVEVIEFVKWTAGEGIEKQEPEGGFAEEVRRLSS